MSEFVFLFRSTDAASRAAMGSPEQMQKSMQTWMTWMKQLTDKGHIKDRGHPLERTGKLVTGKQRTITDGPYAEAKDIVQAVELSLGCPIFEGGGVVEVRPVMKTSM